MKSQSGADSGIQGLHLHLFQHGAVGRCPARSRTSLKDSTALMQGQPDHQFNVPPLFIVELNVFLGL